MGHAASEKLGKVLLERFDRKFLKTLKKCKVEVDVCGIYVDDVKNGLASLDLRVDFKDGKMTFSQERVQKDLRDPADERLLNRSMSAFSSHQSVHPAT